MADQGASSPTYQKICTPSTDHYKSNNEIGLFIIIDSKPPIFKKVPETPGRMTLGRFKDYTSLHNDCYKFYFQSHDTEFGTVKEELVDDDAILPVENGRVVAWVLSEDNSQAAALFEPAVENHNLSKLEEIYQSGNGVSRITNANISPISHKQFFANHYQPPSPAHSFNSFTFANGVIEKSAPLGSPTCIDISLHLDDAQPLGLGHVYPGDECQTNGIIVDHVQHNSIAERDGRIRSGDRIVEVNGVDLRYLSLGEATAIFRRFVERRGKINLTIHRPSGMPKMPPLPPIKSPHYQLRTPPRPPARDSPCIQQVFKRSEPRIGFDPATELPAPIVEPDKLPESIRYGTTTTTNKPQPSFSFHRHGNHQEHQRASQSLPRSLTPRSLYATGNLEDTNSSGNIGISQLDSRSDYEPTTPTSLRSNLYQVPLRKNDDIYQIYATLKADSANLDVKDREWLKVIIKDAFLGSTLIKWLSRNIYGFCNRKEVKSYANEMLKRELIRSPISKAAFSEKCLYTLS